MKETLKANTLPLCIHYPLFFIHYSWSIVLYSLFIIHCSSFIYLYLLSFIHYLLCNVHYPFCPQLSKYFTLYTTHSVTCNIHHRMASNRRGNSSWMFLNKVYGNPFMNLYPFIAKCSVLNIIMCTFNFNW